MSRHRHDPIRHRAPLWGWGRGLRRVGTAIRYATDQHHQRHRVLGRSGLLLSLGAHALWSDRPPRQPVELIVVEGLTDYVAAQELLGPSTAVLGIPGSVADWWGPFDAVRHLRSRPSSMLVLPHPDSSGQALVQGAELQAWRWAVLRVAVGRPKRGMDVAEAIAGARQEGRDPKEAMGLLRARRELRRTRRSYLMGA